MSAVPLQQILNRALILLYTAAERLDDYIHLAAPSTCVVSRRSESQLADAMWERASGRWEPLLDDGRKVWGAKAKGC